MKIMRHEGSPRQSSFGISGKVFYKLCSQVLLSAALRIEQPVAACSRLRIPHKFGTDRRRQDLQGAARNGQSQPRAIRSSAQRTDAVERVTVIYFYFNSQNRLVETFQSFSLQPQFCAGVRAYRSCIFVRLGSTLGQPRIFSEAAAPPRGRFSARFLCS